MSKIKHLLLIAKAKIIEQKDAAVAYLIGNETPTLYLLGGLLIVSITLLTKPIF